MSTLETNIIKAVEEDLYFLEKDSLYLSYLSLMAIQRANSGHPGLPLGCAHFTALLHRHFLKYPSKETLDQLTPLCEDFFERPLRSSDLFRDKFVLSAGHGSALLYSANYLYRNFLTIKDIANFRQAGSPTAGHPEKEIAHGIETTTGPLGQGFANAVGMAIGAKMLSAKLTELGGKQNHDFPESKIFTLFGDGCLMEGIVSEAASLAGHLQLDNFVGIYDSNHISIDGNTDLTLSEDVEKKFQAMGFVIETADGHDFLSMAKSLVSLLSKTQPAPKLLIIKTKIGLGLRGIEGTKKAHGAAPGNRGTD